MILHREPEAYYNYVKKNIKYFMKDGKISIPYKIIKFGSFDIEGSMFQKVEILETNSTSLREELIKIAAEKQFYTFIKPYF